MRIVLPCYKILTHLTPERVMEDLGIIEEVGRSCYLSNGNITPDGKSARRFIKSRIKENHGAIIEFADVAVQLCVDRGVTHELVRHRLASFAQESSRYNSYILAKNGSQITVVLPSQFIDTLKYNTRVTEDHLVEVIDIDHSVCDSEIRKEFSNWRNSCEDSEGYYIDLVRTGVKPEYARAVLPNSTKAIINMKANYREWRHIFELRADKVHAHPDMVYIMELLLKEFKSKIPVVFDDIYPKIV